MPKTTEANTGITKTADVDRRKIQPFGGKDPLSEEQIAEMLAERAAE